MKKLLCIVAIGLAAFGVQAQTAVTGSSVVPLADDSLYQAFGAQAGLARLMDDFVNRLVADQRIGSFFKTADLPRLKSMLTLQLCVVAGGPCKYPGAAMKPMHRDLDIDKSQFNALVEVLQQAMDAQGIRFTEQNRMLAQLAPMHRDIIGKP